MSDYGLLQEVRIIRRGSTVFAPAAISDTELQIEYAGDFDYDPDNPDDSGGTLDLNGARLTYSSIIFGETPEDPDTIVLDAPLAAAADVDDAVYVVDGGQILEDWEAHVTMGEGDAIIALLTVDQRNQWPVGVYADPVPVVLSDGLPWRIEDAPGRTVSGRTAFWNEDQIVVSDLGDQVTTLTHTPDPESLHVRWHPFDLPPSAWSLNGQVITVLDPDGVFEEDDLITFAYSYDDAAAAIVQPSAPEGGTILAFGATGWKFKQVGRTDATDYSAAAFDDSAWTTAQAAFGSGAGFVGHTNWDMATRMWARRTLTGLAVGTDVHAVVFVDRYAVIYLDGTPVYSGSPNGTHLEVTIDGSYITASSMVLAIRATDEAETLGCVCDLELTQ